MGMPVDPFPISDCVPAPKPVLRWLERETESIIGEWVDRLSVLSPSYRRRPRDELMGTVTEAFQANLELISFGRIERIERFIDYITKKRLETGFPLSDVQKAFELFRFIVAHRLHTQNHWTLLTQAVEPINACLSYTIHRFSDHFQYMHERAIRHHARDLERQISLRTAELRTSERRYKMLVEEINDGYLVIRDLRIVFTNQAFCRMHGTVLEKTIGQPFLLFAAPEFREQLHAAYLDVCAEGTSTGTIEYQRLGCPPENAATEMKARVVDLGDGPVIIGICRDISERVAMERKVRESERLAYVGHVVASLSHEIRNPLSSIKMNLQILSRNLEVGGFDRRRLQISVQEVSRLENILHQLLDAARPVNVQLAPVDVRELVRSCVDLMEAKGAEKALEIIPRCAQNLSVLRLDGERLQQALINLMLNAIEASPEGAQITVFGRSVRVNGNRFLELGVKDSGPGIAPGMVPHLFAPFSTDKAQGTGLGLSNVKKIVDAHHGTVQVRSRKGRGAAFVMRLPWRA